MKRAVIALTVLLLFVFGFSVYAAEGGFMSSPSANKTPEVIEVEIKNGDDTTRLVVTGYGDRGTLTPESQKEIEEAYNMIKNSKVFSEISKVLVERAKELGIPETNLSVSDLFDISIYKNDSETEDAGTYSIEISTETAEYFVALMVYSDGKWEIVEDAKVSNGHLTFSTDKTGPFAIVTNNPLGYGGTGDTVLKTLLPLLVCAVALLGTVIVYRKLRTQK